MSLQYLQVLLLTKDVVYVSKILLVLSLAVTVALTIYNAYFDPLRRVPGPRIRAFSIVPHVVSLLRGTEHWDMIKLHEQYGEVVRVAPRRLSFLGNTENWKAIYGFKKRGEPENRKEPTFYAEDFNGLHSLLGADVETHARQRRIVAHAFSDKALREQEPLLQAWAQKLRDTLIKTLETQPTIDMVRLYNYTTFDIMADLTFAEPLHMLDHSDYVPWVTGIFGGIKFGTAMYALEILSRFHQWTIESLYHLPVVKQSEIEHWNYTKDRVDRRLAIKPDRPDFWTCILEKGGDPYKPDATFTLGEHHSTGSLFMLAGSETTATALSGTTYHLLRNPQHLKALTQELRTNFTNTGSLQLEMLARLPLLEACLKEGLRMYPPVPIGLPRQAPRGGCTVGERFVPEGTIIYVHQLSTYYSETKFKHAREFHPERWLGAPEYKDDDLSAFEPFSVGPRNCLGKNLAWHEMRLLLATVLVHFDLELCPESEDWRNQRVFTFWDKQSLMCKLALAKL